MASGHYGNYAGRLRYVRSVQCALTSLADVCGPDFLVTIPFSFIAGKYGVRVVLWCNIVPRVFMSVWAVAVGYFAHTIPTKAIVLGPFLAVFGGECVLQSTIFALTSALAGEYVQR